MDNLPRSIKKSLSPFIEIPKIKREFELSKILSDELDSRAEIEKTTPSGYIEDLLDSSFMNYLRN